MEFPPRALAIQRALAIFLLAAALAASVVERSSRLSSRVRAGKPWPFWLAVREPGGSALPAVHLGVYDPVRRSLVLIHVPEQTKIQGKLTLAKAYANALRAVDDETAATRAVEDLSQEKLAALALEPLAWDTAGRLAMRLPAGEEEDEPAVAAAAALKMRGRSARALLGLAREAFRGLRAGDKNAADALLLTLELRRAPLENLEPALLPDDASAPAFLARAFAPREAATKEENSKAVVAEVLNGTDVQGLASQASKILRSKGVDVMEIKQASRPRSRTVVYDRTGDFSRAARVRAALGCPTAITATRIDPLRGVDASVELGSDCSF